MALAAKLLVGALVLGAGSTATYVAVTGGFGAGGNGTETEAGSEAQAAVSPAAGSSVLQPEPAARQEQPNAPVVNEGVQIPNSGADTNEQVPDANVRAQGQSGVDGGAQRTDSDVEGVRARTPGQEETTVRSQTTEEGSSQSLHAGSKGAENSDGQSLAADSVHVADAASGVGGDEVAGKSSKPENTSGDGQDSLEQRGPTSNAQSQPEGQVAQTGSVNEKGALSPSGDNVSQGVASSPAGTGQGPTTPGATDSASNPSGTDSSN